MRRASVTESRTAAEGWNRAAGNAGIHLAIWVVAIVASVFFLRAASQLLIPIVIAVLISYALEPVVAWMCRYHVPRLAGTTLLLAAILAWPITSKR